MSGHREGIDKINLQYSDKTLIMIPSRTLNENAFSYTKMSINQKDSRAIFLDFGTIKTTIETEDYCHDKMEQYFPTKTKHCN